jgi:hypothetical protein
MDALADDETLGGAGVARDGSAELDVLVADLTAAEAKKLDRNVWPCYLHTREDCYIFAALLFSFIEFFIITDTCSSFFRAISWFCFWSLKSQAFMFAYPSI